MDACRMEKLEKKVPQIQGKCCGSLGCRQLVSHIGVPIQVLTTVLIQLLINASCEVADGGAGACASATTEGDPDAALGSLVRPGPVLVAWDFDSKSESGLLILFLPFSLCCYAIQIKTKSFF